MIKVPGLSKIKIERFSNKIRILCGLKDPYLKCDIARILENILPVLDPSYSFEVKKKEYMNGRMAYYDVIKNKIIVEEYVYNRAIQGNGRDRFTLAHELGHYLLHDDVSLFARNYSNEHIKAYEDPEWQADTFASYFLLPRTELSSFGNPKEIALHYGTSKQAA